MRESGPEPLLVTVPDGLEYRMDCGPGAAGAGEATTAVASKSPPGIRFVEMLAGFEVVNVRVCDDRDFAALRMFKG